MSNKHLLVGFIVVAMAIWMFSGEFAHNTVTADEQTLTFPASAGPAVVRGIRSTAEDHVVLLDVRGQTRANRTVQLKAEVPGKIEMLPGVQGTRVVAGEVVCRLAVDARDDEYKQALAEQKSAQLEFDGFTDLKARGLQSEVLLAKSEAALKQSTTRARQAELALAKTAIRAPFDGVVFHQPVEVGDFLAPGDTCVSVMEIDPMLVVGQVAEMDVHQLALDDQVTVMLITGETLTGRVSFIAHAPDRSTRTFPIEVTVANPGATARAGLTAELKVPVGSREVHLISPATLVLNDAGQVGVRIVDSGSQVRFMPVEVVAESPEGVLVGGLPREISLITIGHEDVFDGQLVTVDFSTIDSLVKN